MTQIEISKRIALLVMFGGLLTTKCLNMNGIIDDLLLLIVGALIGKEVLTDGKPKEP